jgi:phosphoglycerate dehydrogenase-like enzyme
MGDIVVLVPHQEGVAALSEVPGITPVRYDAGGQLPEAAETAQVLVPDFVAVSDALAMTERLPKLQLVQLLSAGAEKWVGRLPEGVALSDCRGAHGAATAEWIVGALLAVYREFPRFVHTQDEQRWDPHETEELSGKRVLLVGAGDLAEHTVHRLAPFDVDVTLVARRARPGVHGIDEVLDLLPHHDACVVIVPLTEETRGLVDAEFLAAMPDGAVLVNVARGLVADTDALIAELTSGRLRAALDVVHPEPLPADHPLWRAPGLFLTPHVAGIVPATKRRAYEVVAEQLGAYARGEKPPNLVENGY